MCSQTKRSHSVPFYRKLSWSLHVSFFGYPDGVTSCYVVAEVPKDGTTAPSADGGKVGGSKPSVADSPATCTSDSDDDLPGEEEAAVKTSSKSPEEKLVKVMLHSGTVVLPFC